MVFDAIQEKLSELSNEVRDLYINKPMVRNDLHEWFTLVLGKRVPPESIIPLTTLPKLGYSHTASCTIVSHHHDTLKPAPS